MKQKYLSICFALILLMCLSFSASLWAGGSMPGRGGRPSGGTSPSGAPEPQMAYLMILAGVGISAFMAGRKSKK